MQASEEGYESIRLSTNWSSASFDHAIVLILSRDSGDVRNNQEWLGKAACDFVDPIKNFWDGSKIRLCQNFWNPAATWELLVVCPQCKTSHKAFPRKCEELLDPRNWDESSQVYKFLCRQCRHLMVSPKQMLQVEFQ